ncbi:MAG: hypothetical protein P8I37_05895, partial [Schleiferiaceae bacterium]|nr:hypothetical protein [Schleiferiaceae bacterium]
TKNRSVAITPSDNSPFWDGKYTPIDKTRKRVSEKFRGLTIGLLCGGADFLIFEPFRTLEHLTSSKKHVISGLQKTK